MLKCSPLKTVGVVLLATTLIGEAAAAEGDTTTSAALLGASTNAGCIAHTAVGFCVWMTCVAMVCEYDYSVKYRHNISDLVITAYKNTGESPWVEVASYGSPTSIAEGGGSNTEGSTIDSEQALRFKNADAIGSPGNLFFYALSSESDYFCPPSLTAYFPYFVSTLDPNWRDPTVETPLTIANAHRRIGKGRSYFGSLFPRTGFVQQGHDYKAGVVNAVRVAQFVTRTAQPHVYYPATTSTYRQGYWPPGSVSENGGLWQQVVPSGNSGCKALPDIDDTYSVVDPYKDRVNQSTGYAWQLWRTYRCCAQEGAVLIFHTGS